MIQHNTSYTCSAIKAIFEYLAKSYAHTRRITINFLTGV
ncbi:hypothetical protein OIU77_023835 [Salix suchowensis]|uniref:Uncharacterized protein n=1 Tax=Salix suchowensis TaxID=1278906 RepID=A0ABQ9C929_9ROSI|nr:hypothetical protein OIU78_010632 [Salix suchowensis]KAJ6394708.1 hypothetical protein OIU77_023835 [Salix suchowensis]